MIITFGSLNADLIYRVAEAPAAGQTIAAESFSLESGGKGANQAVAAARDGAEVVMVGAVGRDPLARVALQILETDGVDVSRVAHVDAPTGNAAILVDAQGRNRITISHGANAAASAAALDDALLRGASSVLLQLESPLPEVEALVLRCAGLGVRTILNLAPARRVTEAALRAAGLLVVNEDEAESLAADLGCAGTASALADALGTDVLRTLGGAGAEAAVGGAHLTVPARQIDVCDTTAAGDCFIGVLAAALDRGASLHAAMARATAAAALCCSVAGSQASLPRATETDRLLAA